MALRFSAGVATLLSPSTEVCSISTYKFVISFSQASFLGFSMLLSTVMKYFYICVVWDKNISHLLPGFSNTSTESTRTELDLIERIINEVVASLKPEEDEQVWHYEN